MLATITLLQGQIPALPWGEIIGIAVFGGGLALVLIRNGLRKPPQLATSDEVKSLERQMAELEADVRGWRAECVTTETLNRFGDRVKVMETMWPAVSDRAADAQHRAEMAELGVAALRSDIADLKRITEGIPASIARLEERLAARGRRKGEDSE